MTPDETLRFMQEAAAQQALTTRERIELRQLREEVGRIRAMNTLPPAIEVSIEHVERPRRPLTLGPLQLTSGGIQYQVDIYLKQ